MFTLVSQRAKTLDAIAKLFVPDAKATFAVKKVMKENKLVTETENFHGASNIANKFMVSN